MAPVGSSSGACAGNVITGGTVDQDGLAQCVPGFSGTAVVVAGTAIKNPSPHPDEGVQLKVSGAAKLTCP
jgi:hypothetical protein